MSCSPRTRIIKRTVEATLKFLARFVVPLAFAIAPLIITRSIGSIPFRR